MAETVHYLQREDLLKAHEASYKRYGGSTGIRDEGILDSCVNQPRQQFGGNDLYPELWDKAAAYAFFICRNHPFVDGNKRTAAIAVNIFFSLNGYQLAPPQGEVYEKFEAIAADTISRDELTEWIRTHMRDALL